MLNQYQITNFKAFANPATIPIKPVTLIFGANSSGKTSILQSLLMLKQTIDKGAGGTALLTRGNLVDLGSFREFIYHHDIAKTFSFKMTMTTEKDWYSNHNNEDNFDLVWSDNISKLFEKLLESIGSDTIGMGIAFSCDKDFPVVTKIELFIGDDPEPILTFERKVLNNKDRHYRQSPDIFKLAKFNDRHKYWRTCLTAFDKDVENKETFIKALEEYKSFIQKDKIQLVHYLPNELNGFGIKYMTWNAHGDDGSAKDVSLLTLYASCLIREFLEHVIYVGPLRRTPERYDTFTGNRTQYVGKFGEFVTDILINDEKLLLDINKLFNRFGLGYEFKVARISDPSSDIHGLLTLRLKEITSGIHVGITDVGFGISQVLPVIVQSMISERQTLLIEQPELHLHPALQAELGDVFIKSALGKQKNNFIIETHSEHLILRLLRRIRETTDKELPDDIPMITPDQLAVLYVQPGENGSEVIHIPVTEDGEFEIPWPQGFFAERAKELF
ncbi:MAG: DUF3696 domain-containing protein [Desulfobacterales bacterium]|nr:DUF3696 domain-containing protein [Desulfobacterales bacterium]